QELERIADQRRYPPVPPTTPVPPPILAPPTTPVPQNKGVSRRVVVFGLIGLVVVGGIALAASLSPSPPPQPPFPTSVPTSDQSSFPTPTPTSDQPSFPTPTPTSDQPSFPNIQGTYSGGHELSTSSSPTSMTLDITRQNQQDFGGTCTLGSNSFPIQN